MSDSASSNKSPQPVPVPSSTPSASQPALKGGINCRTALEQLWEYLDQELGPEKMAAVRTHIELCAKCYPDYDFEKTFLQALSNCKTARCASHHLRDKVLSALKGAGFTKAKLPPA